jgi:hypothetical protein
MNLISGSQLLRLSAGLAFVLAPTLTQAEEKPVDFGRDVKPILARNCYRCHGPLKQQHGLRVDTAAAIAKGGESGAAVVPGKSGESLLIKAITGSDGWKMPPEGKPLSEEEIAVIKHWIDAGAPAPAVDAPADPLAHWAFRLPPRPAVPEVKNVSWMANPIDAFVAAEHEKRGLVASPPAAKPILLRRVYLDLIGLPPTREELAAFLADDSPEAYDKVVTRLLANPQYGERWGRHWMDVWRYSDWAGWNQQVRDSQPHIWRWRDWIVETQNADLPYDQMILHMLAADELDPTNQDSLRATGFLVRNFKLLSRETWMQDTVEHTSKAFLGLTMNCARCHDHMYDPVTQEDYYRLRAVFEPYNVRIDRVPGQLDTVKAGVPRVFDADLAAPTYLFERGDDRKPDKNRPQLPGVPVVFSGGQLKIEPIKLAPLAHFPELAEHVQKEMVTAAEATVAKAREALAKAKDTAEPSATVVTLAEKSLSSAESALAALKARMAADNAKFASPPAANAIELAKAAALAEKQASLAKIEEDVLKAGQELAKLQTGDDKAKAQIPAAEKKLAEAKAKVEPAQKALESPGEAYASLGKVYPAESSGRRLALARWIASRDNPLTARVAVNHLWARHFGQPLVASTFDFGPNGKPPTHPALLDWLAHELMQPTLTRSASEDGKEARSVSEAPAPWTMKHLHRLLVTSSAYRQASTFHTANHTLDADNAFLWRFTPRRLESEAVRDAVLHVAGQLETTLGGPDLDCAQGLTSRRRSLYFRHAPEKQMEFLKLFDAAAPSECYRRQASIVPQQALALANSELALVQSRKLAKKLVEAGLADSNAFAAAAFEQVLARPASPEELKECAEFFAQQTSFFTENKSRLAAGAEDGSKPSADPAQRARENLVHVLLNHHEFVMLR